MRLIFGKLKQLLYKLAIIDRIEPNGSIQMILIIAIFTLITNISSVLFNLMLYFAITDIVFIACKSLYLVTRASLTVIHHSSLDKSITLYMLF